MVTFSIVLNDLHNARNIILLKPNTFFYIKQRYLKRTTNILNIMIIIKRVTYTHIIVFK